ncbi:PcfJ domain-containing protein [Photobacterium leiognathi]|uniref:PcfJ domain-containing protein n=1 Tax=Photobacterium leiognathi TaxID=553611 RepID=UPI0029816067|nr:PcfJ domain-containing protein [Photobacterium leiognathi]
MELNNPDLYLHVLKILKREFPDFSVEKYDDNAVVAGQAIGSAVLEALGLGQGVFNDIDVFINQKPRFLSHSKGLKDVRTGIVFSPNLAGSQLHSYMMNSLHRYRVNSSVKSQSGINHTYITLMHSDDKSFFGINFNYMNFLDAVIAGFDINAIQVCLDLQNRKLHYTDHFKSFIRSLELKLVNFNTPLHSFCRLQKKSREMPWLYFNESKSFCTVAACNQLGHAIENKYGGSEHYEYPLLESWSADLARKLYDLDIQTKPISILRKSKIYRVGRKHHKVTVRELITFKLVEINNESDRLNTIIDQLLSIIPYHQTNLIFALVPQIVELVNQPQSRRSKIDNLERLLVFLKQNDINRSYALLALNKILEQTNKLVFNDTDFKRLFRVLNQPMLLKGIYDLNGNPFLFALKNANWLCKSNYGLKLVGIIESKAYLVKNLTRLLCSPKFRLYADAISKRHMHRDDIITKHKVLPDPIQISGTTIKQLITGNQLAAEGRALQHCVGGYNESILTGRSLIFSLSNDHERSTLELNRNFSIIQHCGFNNKEVSKEQAIIADRLVEFLMNHSSTENVERAKRKSAYFTKRFCNNELVSHCWSNLRVNSDLSVSLIADANLIKEPYQKQIDQVASERELNQLICKIKQDTFIHSNLGHIIKFSFKKDTISYQFINKEKPTRELDFSEIHAIGQILEHEIHSFN